MRGVLIYAFNNERFNYFRQAVWCADRVKRFLGLPCTIVTDQASSETAKTDHDLVFVSAQSGGRRVFNPAVRTQSDIWYNSNRYQSYEITPYEQTIVIDSDYVVNSDRLNLLFESGLQVTAMKHVYDMTNRNGFAAYQSISPNRGLHHYWATVMYFEKGSVARDFFDLLTMIQQNYQHYADIYQFQSVPYRNDFAVSIALNTLYGHLPELIPTIPWAMASASNDVVIDEISPDVFALTYAVDLTGRRKRVISSGQDFHFINKDSLELLYAD